MGFEDFEPIFGEPKVEWASAQAQDSDPLPPFLFRVHASDPSHLTIHVTDFHSNTWEAVKSVVQLEDMRDNIGIGGSWSEFVDYVIASIKSEDLKLVMEGHSNSGGAAYAKLVGQKLKGMPLIFISLTKLVDSAASEAMANLSLELFKAFKNMRFLLREEQEQTIQLTKVISAEKEKNETIQSQLDYYSKRQKFQKMNATDKADVSAPPMINGLQNSPDKLKDQDAGSTKVTNRVVPAFRRAKVRGAFLQDTEDDKDN
ncbi:U2 small nuclear ribonucleoprotein auxiliary factor-like protein [Fagus crenata]